MLRSIVIVGASLAGLRAAEELRRQGFDGRVTVVGDEPHYPYDRPPLSKQLLAGDWEPDRIVLGPTASGGLAGADSLDALEVDWRLGTRATSLDLASRTLTIALGPTPARAGGAGLLAGASAQPGAERAVGGAGETLPFDGLIIATGAAPRQLRGLPGGELAGIHTLRTLDDSLAIRAALDTGPGRVVVIGAGFIGAEVAATCRSRGLDVTLVEALPVPMERALDPEIGALIADIHRDQGVDLRLGVGVTGFGGGARVEQVTLADGSAVPADVVVVGIGVAPTTGWLDGSGLTLDDGVVCDPTGLAAPGVVAAGDVARWPSRRFGTSLRVEHWDNAITMGEHAARRLLHGPDGGLGGLGGEGGEAAPSDELVYDPVPWVWSDQYDRKLQLAGLTHGADEMVVVDGSLAERRFAAIFRRADRVAGVLAMNRPRLVAVYRRLIERDASWDEALHAVG